MEYFWLKLIHILSSTLLFGTGLGSAFYLFMANRRREPVAIYFATKHVVIADWLFTTPTVIIQLLTGLRLAQLLHYPLSKGWILTALLLYGFVGACWLPVVWLQIKMRAAAQLAVQQKTELPQRYWQMDCWWIILGTLAFPAMIFIFYLMVFKPL